MERLFEIPNLNIYMQIGFTLFFIGMQYMGSRKQSGRSLIEIAAVMTIGLAGWFTMSNGLLGHILYADQVASNIGWPLDSGFQMELGFVSIGIGLVGFLGFWDRSFWLPFIIPKTFFGWGAGLTHILHAVQHGNFAPSNVGLIIYWDFLFPIVLIALYLLYRREMQGSPKAAAA